METKKELIKKTIIKAIEEGSFEHIDLGKNMFLVIEEAFDINDNTLIVKRFDSYEDYKSREGEVKDEDTDELYIDITDLYDLVLDRKEDGIYLKDNIFSEENKEVQKILKDKVEYIIDFFNIK